LIGSRRWQDLWALMNAGEDGLIPATAWKSRSSGKRDTPCERMQRAKLIASCWAWARVGLVRPPGVAELDAPAEPHAAIAAAAAITAPSLAVACAPEARRTSSGSCPTLRSS